MQRVTTRGWLPAAIAIAIIVIVNVVLVSRVFSGDDPQPLSPGFAELNAVHDGQATVFAHVRNDGSAPVELIAVSVPGVDAAQVRVPNDETFVRAEDSTEPLRGRRIPADGNEVLEIKLPVRCPPRPTIDRLDVRFKVDGHETSQLLELEPPVKVDCA